MIWCVVGEAGIKGERKGGGVVELFAEGYMHKFIIPIYFSRLRAQGRSRAQVSPLVTTASAHEAALFMLVAAPTACFGIKSDPETCCVHRNIA